MRRGVAVAAQPHEPRRRQRDAATAAAHAALDPPGPNRGATCLTPSDVGAMAALYPDCLASGVAGSPACADTRRNIWAFRLFLTVLPPLSVFFALLLPAVCCVRAMSRRRVRSLAALLTQAIETEEAEAAAGKRGGWFHPDRDVAPDSERATAAARSSAAASAVKGGKGGGRWPRKGRAHPPASSPTA